MDMVENVDKVYFDEKSKYVGKVINDGRMTISDKEIDTPWLL